MYKRQARHFAVSGLCVQPSFAGKNEVGTGNCGAKSCGVENQINAGEERCAEKGHHGAANPACGARAVPLRGVAAELGGEDGRIAGERLIKQSDLLGRCALLRAEHGSCALRTA